MRETEKTILKKNEKFNYDIEKAHYPKSDHQQKIPTNKIALD